MAGIPIQPGEDTNDIVIKVGSLMGLDLDESDISVSHCLPSPSYSSRIQASEDKDQCQRFNCLKSLSSLSEETQKKSSTEAESI